jgi:hypothetical protein
MLGIHVRTDKLLVVLVTIFFFIRIAEIKKVLKLGEMTQEISGIM